MQNTIVGQELIPLYFSKFVWMMQLPVDDETCNLRENKGLTLQQWGVGSLVLRIPLTVWLRWSRGLHA
jgi:hypothetical protein